MSAGANRNALMLEGKGKMDADTFINEALVIGQKRGLHALQPVQQVIFAVSEAEVTCDMDGIDSLIEHYGAESLPLFERAYAAIGALEIADALKRLIMFPASEEFLERVNSLITERRGYGYESIRAYVAARI
ncbi:MAG: hypothetical protein FWC42_10725 [Proteobacteria bacterium]|nr:hypothetical protein [Pseudomonadota bacterium]